MGKPPESRQRLRKIAVTLGDPRGIGPEVMAESRGWALGRDSGGGHPASRSCGNGPGCGPLRVRGSLGWDGGGCRSGYRECHPARGGAGPPRGGGGLGDGPIPQTGPQSGRMGRSGPNRVAPGAHRSARGWNAHGRRENAGRRSSTGAAGHDAHPPEGSLSAPHSATFSSPRVGFLPGLWRVIGESSLPGSGCAP